MESILEILKNMHPQFDYESSKDFSEDEILDSFDVIELVSCIEDKFNIRIDGLDILPENFCNLEAIKDIIIKNGGAL